MINLLTISYLILYQYKYLYKISGELTLYNTPRNILGIFLYGILLPMLESMSIGILKVKRLVFISIFKIIYYSKVLSLKFRSYSSSTTPNGEPIHPSAFAEEIGESIINNGDGKPSLRLKGKTPKKDNFKPKSKAQKASVIITEWQKSIGISLMKSKKGNVFPKGVIALSETDVDVLAEILFTRVSAEYREIVTIALIKSAIIENLKFFNELVINNNVTIGPSIYKKTWTSVLANFRGGEFEQVSGVSYSQKNKIPSKLKSLNVLFLIIKTKGSINGTLFIFHLLESLYATYKMPKEIPELNLSSITDKMTKTQYEFVNQNSKEFRSFLKKNPVQKNIGTLWDNELASLSQQYKLSNGAGPNGVATKTMIQDAYVLKQNAKFYES
jgi:hypothetical protein